ncbi:MAG: hypothetical protein HC894_24570, partial [Microcoleus sp. SM1_3_4]|nr:hypothetical protein [Microcoleus sp. SM1_3_4]
AERGGQRQEAEGRKKEEEDSYAEGRLELLPIPSRFAFAPLPITNYQLPITNYQLPYLILQIEV